MSVDLSGEENEKLIRDTTDEVLRKNDWGDCRRRFPNRKVFEDRGIDFCCGGDSSLAVICKRKKIDVAEMAGKIKAVKQEPLQRAMNYASWGLPFLADYINNIVDGPITSTVFSKNCFIGNSQRKISGRPTFSMRATNWEKPEQTSPISADNQP